MARNKKYSKKLAVIDLILIVMTGGFWLLIMLVRELLAHQG
jgi:hypothetical protein